MRPWYTIALTLGTLFPARMHGQCTVPFVNAMDRLMLFHDGRFVEVDGRPPQRMQLLSDGVFLVDHQGQLCHYATEAPGINVVAPHADEVQTSGDRVAWRVADTLKTLRGGRPVVLSTGVARFQVSDSLVVFVDSIAQELAVSWRGQRFPLATVVQGSARPQWTQGANTVTFFDRWQRRVSLFQHGIVRTLVEDTDVGIAVNGNDIVGYWDEARGEFMGQQNAAPVRLSGLRPVNAQAGDGLLAFVDGTLELKAWRGGEVVQLTDTMPGQYWVKDRTLLYLWAGRLMLYTSAGAVEVEAYVPEQWQVAGDRVVYLDINRELRALHTDGRREHLAREPGIRRFSVAGNAVVYEAPSGGAVVVCGGRRYVY